MSTGKRAITEALNEASRQGFDVRRTGDDHYRVTHPDRDGAARVPSTPGRGRSLANSIADLRRIGVVIDGRANGAYIDDGQPDPQPDDDPTDTMSLVCRCGVAANRPDVLAAHERAAHEGLERRDAITEVTVVEPARDWTLTELTELIGAASTNNVSPALTRMVKAGDIIRVGKGLYRHPSGAGVGVDTPDRADSGPIPTSDDTGAPGKDADAGPDDVAAAQEATDRPERGDETPQDAADDAAGARAPDRHADAHPTDPTQPGALLEVVAYGPRAERIVARDEAGGTWIARRF